MDQSLFTASGPLSPISIAFLFFTKIPLFFKFLQRHPWFLSIIGPDFHTGNLAKPGSKVGLSRLGPMKVDCTCKSVRVPLIHLCEKKDALPLNHLRVCQIIQIFMDPKVILTRVEKKTHCV